MKHIVYLLMMLVLGLTACEHLGPKLPADNQVLAGPLPDLDQQQMAQHVVGDELFAEVHTAADGLGPIYVAQSCEACHVGDGKGHPFNNILRERHFSHVEQIQNRSIPGVEPEQHKYRAKASFMAPMVVGLGYFEAVEKEYLIDIEQAQQNDTSIISGRVAWVDKPEWLEIESREGNGQGKFIGKFGLKATAINLLHQTVNAYSQDMGITTDFLPHDLPHYQYGETIGDNVADPELSASAAEDVAFYIRTLKAPTPRNPEDHVYGKKLFTDIGCNSCHRDVMQTGYSIFSALDQVEFSPYTDLLLHDLGGLNDEGYTEGAAAVGEWRTAPLWGLSLNRDAQGGQLFLMHDGSATSIHEAIQFHGGEAQYTRNRFNQLSETDKEALIQFVESL